MKLLAFCRKCAESPIWFGVCLPIGAAGMLYSSITVHKTHQLLGAGICLGLAILWLLLYCTPLLADCIEHVSVIRKFRNGRRP